jgi:hypothetical protein
MKSNHPMYSFDKQEEVYVEQLKGFEESTIWPQASSPSMVRATDYILFG